MANTNTLPVVLQNPESRFQRRPRPAPQVDLSTVVASDQENVSLLLYVQDLDPNGKDIKEKIQDDIELTDYIQDQPIGQEYMAPEETYIFGNPAARKLLNEFNATIDIAKDVDDGGVKGIYNKRFSMNAMQGSVQFYSNLSTKFALEYMKVRLRNLEHNIFFDPNVTWKPDLIEDSNSRRTITNSAVIHTRAIEIDALWAGFFPHLDDNDIVFRQMRRTIEAVFEAAYHVRINEALTLLRYATERPNGIRSEQSKRCSHIVLVINCYAEHREFREGQIYTRHRRRNIEQALARRRRDWIRYGGMASDRAYEEFLAASFRVMANYVYELDVPQATDTAWKNQLRRLIDAVNAEDHGDISDRMVARAAQINFSETVRVAQNPPEPIPAVPLAMRSKDKWEPPPGGRQPVLVQPDFLTRLPWPNDREIEEAAPRWDEMPALVAGGGTQQQPQPSQQQQALLQEQTGRQLQMDDLRQQIAEMQGQLNTLQQQQAQGQGGQTQGGQAQGAQGGGDGDGGAAGTAQKARASRLRARATTRPARVDPRGPAAAFWSKPVRAPAPASTPSAAAGTKRKAAGTSLAELVGKRPRFQTAAA
ncbi:hypothetical protein GGR52DRAFT_576618 [Hypoxylon sp. FL1284]|nr:hypothetical protein GGR52DRAFT_576618 [Hypoxylon sp. FL1284]